MGIHRFFKIATYIVLPYAYNTMLNQNLMDPIGNETIDYFLDIRDKLADMDG